MFRNFFKTAFRHLARHKVSAAINVLGLTLGITACLAIYAVVDFEFSFDTFHPDLDRIYRVVGLEKMRPDDDFRPVGFGPRAVAAALGEEVSGLERIAPFHNVEMSVTIADSPEGVRRFERAKPGVDRAAVIVTSPAYFDIFKYEWLAGDPVLALEEPHKVVLTEAKARLYFGGDVPERWLGRQLMYDKDVAVTVSGIVRDWTQNTDFTFTDFISLSTIRSGSMKNFINLDEWNDIWSASQLFVKLRTDADPAQLNAQFDDFSKRHFGPDHGTGDFIFIPRLQPLRDLHFNAGYRDNFSRQAHLPTLYALMGIAGLILLLAAINFVNLTTAQSVRRASEIGIRKLLGGDRWALLARSLGETGILTALSLAAAVLLTPYLLRAFADFLPEGIKWAPQQGHTPLFLGGMLLVVTLLSGLYPAWLLSGYRPALAIRRQSTLYGDQRGRLRKGLIVFQFTFSLVLINAALIVQRQMDFVRAKDLGLSSDAIALVGTLNDDRSHVLAEKMSRLAGVERVAMEWFPPAGEGYMLTKIKRDGASGGREYDVSVKVGDENFIPLYELKIVAGRNYRAADTLSELVINQHFAHVLGFSQPQDAIGQLLNFNGQDYPIVGVVADFHEQSLHLPISSVVIAPILNMAKNISVKLAAKGKNLNEVQATLDAMAQTWASVYPENPFSYTFMDDAIARMYGREQKTASLLRWATLVAIFISCIGLLGLISFMAEQRAREIGIRKVLGASVAGITGLLAKDFMRLVLVAVALASPLAYYLGIRWLANFAYRVDIGVWTFMLAGSLAMLVAFLTVGVQSVRAALASPIKNIRND